MAFLKMNVLGYQVSSEKAEQCVYGGSGSVIHDAPRTGWPVKSSSFPRTWLGLGEFLFPYRLENMFPTEFSIEQVTILFKISGTNAVGACTGVHA